MATTMHAHIEYRTKDGDWLHYAAPDVKADYRLFSIVAGIRSETTGIRRPLAAPRGLPPDLSEVTRISYGLDKDNGSLKGETWLGADEFVRLQERWNELNPGLGSLEKDFEETVFSTYGPGGTAIATHNGFEDARVVFWFED